MVEEKFLWEILVPTVRPNTKGERFFTTRYHRVWDSKVREITGGLTIMGAVKGQWINGSGTVFEERMIPVRIVATRSEIDKVIDLTLAYYEQEAVLCYKLSNTVILKISDRKNTS
jgi:hypothetical protein